VKRYEYKTVEIKLRGVGLFAPKKAEGFEEVLNSEGRNGWRYVDTVLQTAAYGEVGRLKLVFERETNGNAQQAGL